MSLANWKRELMMLLDRYPELGMCEDVQHMTEAELYRVLAYLRRYAEVSDG